MKKSKVIILLSIFILMCIGVINIYNAKYLNVLYKNYYIKQIIWIFLSLIIFYVLQKINLRNIFKISYIFYIINIILLILVLIIGKEINGTKGWLQIKGFSFQPSETMKIALALFLININKVNERKSINILKLILITFIPSVLVFIEPDTGAVIFYLCILFIMLLSKNIKFKYYVYIILPPLIFFIITIYLYKYKQDVFQKWLGKNFYYRLNRIFNYKDSYQMDMAITSVYATSLIKNGFNNMLLYIPEGVTDFIYAYCIGNFGILNFFIINLLFIIIIYNSFDLIKINNDKKTNYLIISFITIFFVNILINILMNIGLIPIIGITLPFVSYGGTSILVYFMFLAIIFNLTNKDI